MVGADDDATEALTQVLEIRRQSQDRHDLGGHRDVEAGLARVAVGLAAEADDDVLRSARSLRSTTRGQLTLNGLMPSALPWWMWLSMAAEQQVVRRSRRRAGRP